MVDERHWTLRKRLEASRHALENAELAKRQGRPSEAENFKREAEALWGPEQELEWRKLRARAAQQALSPEKSRELQEGRAREELENARRRAAERRKQRGGH